MQDENDIRLIDWLDRIFRALKEGRIRFAEVEQGCGPGLPPKVASQG